MELSQQNTDGLAYQTRLASQGSPEALQKFYQAFLNHNLYIPEKKPSCSMTNQVESLELSTNLLGVNQEDRVVVPVFSESSLIKNWCKQDLELRTITGKELLELVPAGWWLCLNPGDKIEKELSPWEIEQLKAGDDSIPVLVEEVCAEQAAYRAKPTKIKVSNLLFNYLKNLSSFSKKS